LKLTNFPYPVIYRPRSGDPRSNFWKASRIVKLESLTEPKRRFRDPSFRRFDRIAGCGRGTQTHTHVTAIAIRQGILQGMLLCWTPCNI